MKRIGLVSMSSMLSSRKDFLNGRSASRLCLRRDARSGLHRRSPALLRRARFSRRMRRRTETLKLRGLDTDARYSVCAINCGGRLHLVGGARFIASVAGRDLMERGLDITLFGGYDSAVFEICKKEQSR